MDRYYYKKDPGHIWLKKDDDSTYKVGFDYFGQFQAGEIMFIRTRPVGSTLNQGATFGTVETEKWIGPLRFPLTAEIIEVNEAIVENPKLINESCYTNWIIRIKPTQMEKDLESENLIKDKETLRTYIINDLQKYDDPEI